MRQAAATTEGRGRDGLHASPPARVTRLPLAVFAEQGDDQREASMRIATTRANLRGKHPVALRRMKKPSQSGLQQVAENTAMHWLRSVGAPSQSLKKDFLFKPAVGAARGRQAAIELDPSATRPTQPTDEPVR